MKFKLALGASLYALLLSSPVSATTTEASFYGRVQLAPPKTTTSPTPAPTPAPTPTETFNYVSGEWSGWSSQCSNSAFRTRTVTCQNINGATVDDQNCASLARPDSIEASANFSSCSYNWQAGSWSGPSSTCSTSAIQTRTVTCKRSDGQTAADADCASEKPDASQVNPNYTGCSYEWKAGNWVEPTASCSANSTRTRAVSCERSDGQTVGDSLCSAVKPASSEMAPNYESCSFTWNTGSWSAPSSDCSAAAVKTRTVTCKRSDGQNADDASCATPKPSSSEVKENYEGCTVSWKTGDWSPASSNCSATSTRSRAVTCERSDGSTLPDASCAAVGPKPQAIETSAQYGSCSYEWSAGAWSAVNNTCSSTATQTRTVTCKRSDGSTVSDGSCTAVKPTTTQTVPTYSGCSYDWSATAWSALSSTCSATATQTRAVTCKRSDGTTVSDSSCATTKPTSSQTVPTYSGCSYEWSLGGWSAVNNTCSATATQTRAVTCKRSDGTTAPDASCTAAKPATMQTTPTYSGCTFAWSAGNWSAVNNTCSATATQTRAVTCKRSDGTTAADASCTAAKPATTQTTPTYSGCTFAWSAGDWGPVNNTCSATATQTRTVTCKRSDGATAADASCTAARPSTTQTNPTYSGCSYSWNTGAWSGASSTCSETSTKTRTVTCVRSDGQVVGDASCTAAKPSAVEVTPVLTSCTYRWNIGEWSGCSANYQVRGVNCQRSDGHYVVDSFCSAAGTKAKTSQSCRNDDR